MQNEIIPFPNISPEIRAAACRRNGSMQDRFWRKIFKTDNCWFWIGGSNEHRYGVFWFRNRLHKAHRVSWIIHNGEIPDGMDILHKCDNPPCVRPDHLFVGDAKINGLDAASKHRTPQGERHWNSKLTAEQVLEIRANYVKWAKNQSAVAAKYGISVITLRNIVYNRHWRHL